MQQRGLDGMGMPKQVYRLQGLRDMSTYPERKVQRQRNGAKVGGGKGKTRPRNEMLDFLPKRDCQHEQKGGNDMLTILLWAHHDRP